jgi:hypothetical protein
VDVVAVNAFTTSATACPLKRRRWTTVTVKPEEERDGNYHIRRQKYRPVSYLHLHFTSIIINNNNNNNNGGDNTNEYGSTTSSTVSGDDDDDDEEEENENYESESSNTKTVMEEPSISLDQILEKARKRSNPMLVLYQVQAFLDGPLWTVQVNLSLPSLSSSSSSSSPTTPKLNEKIVTLTLKRSDTLLVLVSALIIHSPGFAVGWIIGKVTMSLLLLDDHGPLRVLRRRRPLPAPVVVFIQPFWPVIWAVVIDQIFPL